MLELPLCVLALWRTDTILWLLENSIWCQILVNKLSPPPPFNFPPPPPPFPLSPLSKGFEINTPLEGLIEDLRYPRNKKKYPRRIHGYCGHISGEIWKMFNCRHHEKRIIVRRPLSSKTIDEVARQTKKLKLNVEIRKKVTPIFCCFLFSTVTGNWLESGKPHQSSFQ